MFTIERRQQVQYMANVLHQRTTPSISNEYTVWSIRQTYCSTLHLEIICIIKRNPLLQVHYLKYIYFKNTIAEWLFNLIDIAIISTLAEAKHFMYSTQWQPFPLIQGSHFFPNTKFQVFSRFLVLNSRFFQGFLCQIPGAFIQILVLKILKCVKTDACSHFSCDTKFCVLSSLFSGKSNEM